MSSFDHRAFSASRLCRYFVAYDRGIDNGEINGYLLKLCDSNRTVQNGHPIVVGS
jgi:hypothetical protein